MSTTPKSPNPDEIARIMAAAKKYNQDRISKSCRCGGKLLVIGQYGGGGACGSRISVDIEYQHKCPKCGATCTSSVTYDDDDF
mmetsp:Transcript_3329/g.6938  ORF Transcript_3329/g.6938 Transcript_3329/m.6938 type:complete len:83 (-) Transcript_3329:7-255(-)